MHRFLFFLFPLPVLAFSVLSAAGNPVFIPGDTGASRDSGNYVVVNEIFLAGNKVTKPHIILREIPFHPGDTIFRTEWTQKLASARQNLLNTSLFNFVTADTFPLPDKRVNVVFTLAERWYTWPVPIFEVQERNFNTWWETRNFNRANYGFYLNRDNFRGRKEELSFYAQFGYTEKYGVSYSIPYLTSRQTSGAGFSFAYARNREIVYGSANNQVLYFKDPGRYIREELSEKLHYTYRDGIHNKHYLELKFVHTAVNDTVRTFTTDYLQGNQTEMKYFGLDYSYRSDYRDSRPYPLRGYFWEFEATQLGFGVLKDEKLDVTNFSLTARGYEKLSNRFYLAEGSFIKFSPSRNQPYYVQQGLGWRNYIRGYEYYVIDAQSYGFAKFGLRYEILKPRIQSVNVPALSKFSTFHYALYAGIFCDAGYANDRQYYKQNPLANQLIYGYGAGLDYVTYYDLVIRLEYSFNQMMEHGFFVHFDSGI